MTRGRAAANGVSIREPGARLTAAASDDSEHKIVTMKLAHRPAMAAPLRT
jgi:hypothetical protein